MTCGLDSGSQIQRIKCIKTYFSVPQQGVVSSATVYSGFALEDNPNYNGLRPLIVLGPNTPKEASAVLNVVRFYSKLMVRNVIIKIKVSRRTSRDVAVRPTLMASITVNFQKYPPLPQNKNG